MLNVGELRIWRSPPWLGNYSPYGCIYTGDAGEGPNGAIIHYRAAEPTCATVTKDSHLLIDSGGQYDVGTTDVRPHTAPLC